MRRVRIEKRLKLVVHNLFFLVKLYDKTLSFKFNNFKMKLSTWKWEFDPRIRRMTRKLDTEYFSYDPYRRMYRFPINSLKVLLGYLASEGVTREEIKYKDKRKEIQAKELDVKLHAPFTPRDEQVLYLTTIKENLQKKILLIDAPTGFGKSYLTSTMLSQIGLIPVFILLPKYIEKWVDDCYFYFKIPKEEICVIQGAGGLAKLLNSNPDDLHYKIYIFSLPTLDVYIKNYEVGENPYPVKPHELMSHLQAGVIVNDETHNSFRQIVSTILYLDAKIMLCSSASFDSNNRSLRELYKIVIPLENRISNLTKVESYVNVKAISYDLKVTKGIKWKRPQGYNHILYEESLMKFTFIKLRYFEMIDHYLKDIYFNRRIEENDKVAIFFASIAMCDDFTGYLESKYPNESIYKYVGGTSYGDMLNSKIIISNQQMLGTGIDLKGLIGVLQTVSTSSLQANIQNFGRLRKIPNREIWYYYLYNTCIQRQIQMANERYHAVKDKIKAYYGEEYSKKLNG